MTQWERWIRRYVWDDERTPYLTAPAAMTKRQADYEPFAYAVLIACLFLLIALSSAAAPPIAFYGLSVAFAAIALAAARHPAAACFLETAPVAAALYLLFGGFPDHLATIDHLVLAAIIMSWAAYGLRVISLAKAYEAMAD